MTDSIAVIFVNAEVNKLQGKTQEILYNNLKEFLKDDERFTDSRVARDLDQYYVGDLTDDTKISN